MIYNFYKLKKKYLFAALKTGECSWTSKHLNITKMLKTGKCTFSDWETVYMFHDTRNQKQNSGKRLEISYYILYSRLGNIYCMLYVHVNSPLPVKSFKHGFTLDMAIEQYKVLVLFGHLCMIKSMLWTEPPSRTGLSKMGFELLPPTYQAIALPLSYHCQPLWF